jgi:hypothetical protein
MTCNEGPEFESHLGLEAQSLRTLNHRHQSSRVCAPHSFLSASRNETSSLPLGAGYATPLCVSDPTKEVRIDPAWSTICKQVVSSRYHFENDYTGHLSTAILSCK